MTYPVNLFALPRHLPCLLATLAPYCERQDLQLPLGDLGTAPTAISVGAFVQSRERITDFLERLSLHLKQGKATFNLSIGT